MPVYPAPVYIPKRGQTASIIAAQYSPNTAADAQLNILRNATGLGDPFYGPIVQRIDRIFQQMGVVEEGCKERLVCSMYKNPARFSPHSNFISAELSRDTHELQKPTSTNPAVIRFYKYVQAAREGQDQGDCIRTYPQCPINTER
uniref:Uncharacterized protein n=1 Tax=Lutzomyia longipalpis TaxID=7200 RepID=A0A1B0C8P2_LUTLO